MKIPLGPWATSGDLDISLNQEPAHNWECPNSNQLRIFALLKPLWRRIAGSLGGGFNPSEKLWMWHTEILPESIQSSYGRGYNTIQH